MSPKPLEKVDIVVTIFNQEEIIEKVLYGIFRNTTTPFNLILIFDGCTDRTKARAMRYIKKSKPFFLQKLIIKDTPNLFELRANNFAFKLAETPYLITVQDDMIIREYGWERRLTYPLRKFDDVFAVTARVAENIKSIGNGTQEFINRMGNELGTLPRNIFAVRDVINRGPIAFRTDYLRELNYLNDQYAPGALDDYEISLRAWKDKKWKAGAFWIDYFSHQAWSKVNAPDSTMKAWDSWRRNNDRIYLDFKEYIDSLVKHNEDFTIDIKEIDYIGRYSFFKKLGWLFKYPLRVDKRALEMSWRVNKKKYIEAIKKPFIRLLGKRFTDLAEEYGLKKGTLLFFKKNKSSKTLSVCIPTSEIGVDFLRHNFNILKDQTFKDFDVIISDQSETDEIKKVCEEYRGLLDIHYVKSKGNIATNLNTAIRNSRGKIIKFILQKDFLYKNTSLEEIVKNFDVEKDHWLINASEHTKEDGKTFYWPAYQRYNDEIYLGTMTITSLSVLTIKNDNPLLFDKKLRFLMEGDYYKRCYLKFGKPKVMNTIESVSRTLVRGSSDTSIMQKKQRGREYRYILKKYHEKKLLDQYDNRKVINIDLPKVTLIVSGKMARKISTDGIRYHEILETESKDRIATDFALFVSNNGYVLRPYKWNNKFLEYDYIGLPSGAFSLQSKKFIKGKGEIKYAPPEIVKEFCNGPESFGFDRDRKFIPKFFVLRKILKRLLKR